jgi:hypothetical protein
VFIPRNILRNLGEKAKVAIDYRQKCTSLVSEISTNISSPSTDTCILQCVQRGGFEEFKHPRNSEVLTKLSRIPSSVENKSVTT